jgi:hypothetical protein
MRFACLAVLRVFGSSGRPLFVAEAGIPRADAADPVRRMAGRHRLPDAPRRADIRARAGPPAATMTSRQHD